MPHPSYYHHPGGGGGGGGGGRTVPEEWVGGEEEMGVARKMSNLNLAMVSLTPNSEMP